MKDYNIIKLNIDNEYINLIVMCNANSPFDYMDSIKEDLDKINDQSKVIIDQILHVGNNRKRFIEFFFNKPNSQVEESIGFVDLPKSSIIRKTSCDYLRSVGLIDFSILTTIQKRMINKGIAI